MAEQFKISKKYFTAVGTFEFDVEKYKKVSPNQKELGNKRISILQWEDILDLGELRKINGKLTLVDYKSKGN